MDQATFTISNCPIFSVGQWNGDVYTEADLDHMVAAFGSVGFQPPLKLGHDERQPLGKSDGMPSIGWVANLRRAGQHLLCDLKNLPKKVYEAIRRKNYNRVSAEVYWDFQANGKTYPRVLKALALLGADVPAVTSLEALETLYHDAEGTPFRKYDMQMPVLAPTTGPTLVSEVGGETYETPRKAKTDVAYREAGTGGLERCGACKYFQGGLDPKGEHLNLGNCTLVEGEIASTWTCDLYEPREAFTASGEREATAVIQAKGYVIEQRGDEWCLIAKFTGKTLGCHKTRAGAEAQERAVQASKADYSLTADGIPATVKWITLSRKAVAEACPSCAEHMDFLNIKELKLTWDPATKTYAGFNQGMCDKFGDNEGFRTRCMGSPLAGEVDDAGAFCNALKEFCFGTTKETTQQTASVTVLMKGTDARILAGSPATRRRQRMPKYAIEERDGKHCVIGEGGEVMKCFPTREEADAYEASMMSEGAEVRNLIQQLDEAKGQVRTLTERLSGLDAKMKVLTQQATATQEKLTAAEAEKATLAEQRRQSENTAWLDAQSTEANLRMTPKERPYASFVLDVLTSPNAPNGGTQVKTYKAEDGKELTPVAVFKRLYESRTPNTALFEELSEGTATEDQGSPRTGEAPESMAEARFVATSKTRAYMKTSGEKDFRIAYAHVLDEDPVLKDAVAGVTPQGQAKADEGVAAMTRMYRGKK